ncbi:synaptic vesicle glycoprotein 2B-like [Sitodiplosis mosellana]|uniref:synaptic vesicle glycoprotein 2B-like n=1 Tax=Sitodiplosis mosellana TaxID=263140 RepID=UPI002443ED4D|nr:synaptic vesicle glycoprotein 2B-like [Sitodiplosis mosellana]
MGHSEAENGRRNSDVRPQISRNQTSRRKILCMEEAISKTNFGLFNYYIIFVSGVILFALAMETSSIIYVIPVACDMNLTTGQKGVLGSVVYFGILCSSYLFGYLADTKGRHCIIQPTLFLACFMSIICSFFQNFYVFIALRFLNGFFMSGSAANIFAYLGEFHNNSKRGHALIGSTVIYSGLCMIIPLTAYSVINQDWQFQIPFIDVNYRPWRLFMVVCGTPGLVSALLLFFLPESPKFVLAQGDREGAYQILRKMHRWNNGEKSEFEDFEIREEIESINSSQGITKSNKSLLKTIWYQTVPLFKPPYLKSTTLLCLIQFGIYATGNGFFMFFGEIINGMSIKLDSFTEDRAMMCDVINMKTVNMSAIKDNEIDLEVCIDKLELSTIENGFIFELLYTVCLAISGMLLNRVGKFPVTFFILVTTGLSGIGCMLTDVPLLQISFYIWLLSCQMASNVLNAVTVDLYPTTMRAMAISISLMFGRLGSIAGSNTAAILLDDHCEAAFYLSGLLTIAMGVLAFFIPNIHKRVKNSDEPDTRLSIVSFTGSVKSFH